MKRSSSSGYEPEDGDENDDSDNDDNIVAENLAEEEDDM